MLDQTLPKCKMKTFVWLEYQLKKQNKWNIQVRSCIFISVIWLDYAITQIKCGEVISPSDEGQEELWFAFISSLN